MRVAVVQFAPKIGRVQENIETARKLCEQIKPHSVDLVCFPEMVFTGYVFPDARSITPHLEQPGKGPTSRFCADLAARLQCHVVAGYPERLDDRELGGTAAGNENAIMSVGANSAILYGPDGALIGGYRKTNLFEIDMTWAKAGTGFATFSLPKPLNNVSMGICMDLNPQQSVKWSIEGPYEIADHCISKRSNLLILLNAWLDSGSKADEQKDWYTLQYWASRLKPLWAGSPLSIEGVQGTPADETIVIICNRCGEENGKTFAGTSSVFRMRQGSGRPQLLHAMERHEEGVALWDIPTGS
ncbi:carbon-nitrogen hydrolase [Laetiporus sulphureus 93-53]|uniref:Carbon-nitrogen hydrolase n=1 Tax=Laetiporus sulphureus 93-53 TaxID=1314785 RepID=A0A165HKI3_9APHY|nr:carbon-nitrogen hydrolase [Laetiporus sulphureus 93-53]KZT11849.1 carbon-nitrogen hydrolase [Laetiporus sulphureus 93-53]